MKIYIILGNTSPEDRKSETKGREWCLNPSH